MGESAAEWRIVGNGLMAVSAASYNSENNVASRYNRPIRKCCIYIS